MAGCGRVAVCYITPLSVSKKFVPLCMGPEIEIHNRIRIGFAIGWAYYSRDKDHNWSELTLYLGLISVIIKY